MCGSDLATPPPKKASSLRQEKRAAACTQGSSARRPTKPVSCFIRPPAVGEGESRVQRTPTASLFCCCYLDAAPLAPDDFPPPPPDCQGHANSARSEEKYSNTVDGWLNHQDEAGPATIRPLTSGMTPS